MFSVLDELLLDTRVKMVVNVMHNLNVTVDQAMVTAKIPESYRNRVRDLVEASDRATAECTINAMRTSRFH